MSFPDTTRASRRGTQRTFFARLLRDLCVNWRLYLMVVPMIIYYILFHYVPMWGAQIAFKDFIPAFGIDGSQWVGLKHFTDFISSNYFSRIVGNTLIINVLLLAFSFPASIILALLLNELRSQKYKRVVQTFSYLPHFISIMVVAGMITDFTASRGIINDIIEMFGGQRQTFLQNPNAFRPIYIVSEVWQTMGWGSIIYIAALASIDVQQYEAALLDGANRWQKTLYITLPGIAPTIIIMLIMRLGQMMNVGFEKIILLYKPSTYITADVISSFVYRRGLEEFAYSYSTAVGMFNSVINMIFLVTANFIARKTSETSLF